ncbi:MAG TPA: CPBP family intramembrane metalloprotease [Clostridiales bacterium]|nr:CPBP family intramembrane metalloprotease [Clostridiales bacterium]
MFIKTPEFHNAMKRSEKILGWMYLPLHIFVIPVLLGIYSYVAPDLPKSTTLNVVYYVLGIVYVLVFMRGFLRKNFDIMLDNKLNSLLSLVSAYFLNAFLSYIALLIIQFFTSELENPNNEFVNTMAREGYNAVFAIAVFLGPIVEEVLFRGVVFGSIRRKSRLLAYVVSVAVFSLYHVWQYAIIYMDPTLLLYALQYIPVSIALAWSYEKSGSIWVPIFFHMAVNALSLAYLNM